MNENNTYRDQNGDKKLPDSVRVNPFVVPQGYFEQSSSFLKSVAKSDLPITDSFSVPEGYFDSLESNIKSLVRIDQKLDHLQSNTSVPEGYFDQLAANIHIKIKEEDIRRQVGESGFDVPSEYFENAQSQLLSISRLDKAAQSEQAGFDIPVGYFESLQQRIKAKTNPNSIKVETPIRTLDRISWWKYASAACMAVIISVGAYLGLGNPADTQTNNTVNTVRLESISNEELVDYLALNGESDDLLYYAEYIYTEDTAKEEQNIKNLEDEDLGEYIKHML